MGMSTMTVYKKKQPRRKRQPKNSTKLVTKKSLNRALTKFCDTRYYRAYGSLSIPNWAGTNVTSDLTAYAVGDNNGNRSGDSISIKGIRYRGSIVSSDTYNYVRMVIVQWNSQSSTAPVPEDIFDNSYGLSGVANQGIFAFYNVEKKSEYTILADKLFALAQVGGNPLTLPFDIRIPGKKCKTVTYNSSASTNGFGHIYVICLSDSAVANHPVMYYNVQVDYTA